MKQQAFAVMTPCYKGDMRILLFSAREHEANGARRYRVKNENDDGIVNIEMRGVGIEKIQPRAKSPAFAGIFLLNETERK